MIDDLDSHVNVRFAPEAAGRESCSGRTRLLTRCRSFARDIATRGTRWRRISHAARVKSNLASIHSRTVELHVEGGTEAVGPVQKACEAALLCTRSPSWTTRITSILTPLQFCENGRSLKGERISAAEGARPYLIVDSTLGDCIQQFMAKPPSQQHLYEIHTAPQGELVSAILTTRLIPEIARLRDFL